MSIHEVRCYDATELRAVGGSGDADPLRLEGYAATFGVYSRAIGGSKGFREKIRPGAFNRVISERQDVRCLFNHLPSQILGRTTASTLSLRQDQKGLFFSCMLPNTQQARDLHESVGRGDISNCSFSFNVANEGQVWSTDTDKDGISFVSRELTDLDVYDVSPVTFPAYESGTSVQARSVAVTAPEALMADVERRNAEHEVIEARIYGKDKPAPDYVPDEKKAQWVEVWNSVYKKAIASGTAAADAEAEAFKQANGVAGPKSGKDSTDMSAENRSTVGDAACPQIPDSWKPEVKAAFKTAFDAAFKQARENGKKGNEAYAEAASAAYIAICKSLTDQDVPGTAVSDKITEVDTSNGGSISGGIDEANRAAILAAVERRDLQDKQDEEGEGDDEEGEGDGDFDETDIEDRGEVDPSKLATDHMDDGNCANPSCGCQNRFGFHKKQERAWDPSQAQDVAGKISKHVRASHLHSQVAEIEAGRKHDDAKEAHEQAAKKHAAAAEAQAGLAGQTKEVADQASTDAQASTDEAVRCSMRCSMRAMDDATKEFNDAAGAVQTAHEGHKADYSERSAKAIGDAHAAHAVAATKYGASADAENDMRSALSCFRPTETAVMTSSRSSELTKEVRSVTTRTKRVAGKDLPASAFAFVGDPNDTSTWKFPIHDESHARNALSRWGQDKGIPESARAGVFAKIKAACKKFGIEVNPDDAKRSADMRRQMLAEYLERMGPDADTSFLA